MTLYARAPVRRAGQIAADAIVALWILLWWNIGRFADGFIRGLADPARQASQATTDLQRQLTETADAAARIPLAGNDLRRPLDAMSDSLGRLDASVGAVVAHAEQAASWLGWLAFLVPVAIALLIWLPWRIRFVRRAADTWAVTALPEGAHLLALRALTGAPMKELIAISADPAGAWRAADPDVIARLARLERIRAGIEAPVRSGPDRSSGS